MNFRTENIFGQCKRRRKHLENNNKLINIGNYQSRDNKLENVELVRKSTRRKLGEITNRSEV